MNLINRTYVRAVILRAVSSEVQAADDKVSLETQNTDCLAYCHNKGYTVIANLVIPGFSRYDSDLERLFAEFRKQDVTAMDELAELFRKRGLDVLIGYHPSRFGRSTTLFTWVVENIVRSGGRVEFVKGGMIDAQNLPLANAMSAYVATDGVTKLVADKKAGMRARAKRGLPVSSKLPFFHECLRDERDKQTPMTVNRYKYERLTDDLYDLVVNEQVAWDVLEVELFNRGHCDDSGNKYTWHYFYNVVQHPPFWGHVGVGYASRRYKDRAKYALWMIDETLANQVPPGVEIYYNVCESVYEGDRRVRFMAEMYNRFYLVRGKAQTRSQNAFSGLLVCNECGYPLAHTAVASGYRGYRCPTRYVQKREYLEGRQGKCSQNKSIRFNDVRSWFDRRIQRAILNDDYTPLLLTRTPSTIENQLARLRRDYDKATARLEKLAMRLADAPTGALQSIYEAQDTIAQERDALYHQIKQLELRKAIGEQANRAVELAAGEIMTAGNGFWSLPEHEIHRILHLMMGRWRLVVEAGEIIGLLETIE